MLKYELANNQLIFSIKTETGMKLASLALTNVDIQQPTLKLINNMHTLYAHDIYYYSGQQLLQQLNCLPVHLQHSYDNASSTNRYQLNEVLMQLSSDRKVGGSICNTCSLHVEVSLNKMNSKLLLMLRPGCVSACVNGGHCHHCMNDLYNDS